MRVNHHTICYQLHTYKKCVISYCLEQLKRYLFKSVVMRLKINRC